MIARAPRPRLIASAALALALSLLPAAGGMARTARAGMTTVRFSFSTWTGYGALVVGAKKGFFQKYGIDPQIILVESANARRAALQAGKLDGAATTVDTFSRWAAVGASAVQVFGIDKSVGGDGIVSKKSITSVKQIKGLTVAVQQGSTSEWFLYYVLSKNGMSVKDIRILDMPDSGVAGQTFRAGKVDVAVTWEPWLTRAEQTPGGHILISSKTYPDIIVDVFGFRPDFLKAHPDLVMNFTKGYYDAVNYIKSSPKDSYQIIGKYFGETADQVAGDFTTVKLMDLQASKAYYGTAAKHGAIYGIAKQSADFWLSLGTIKQAPDINAIIDTSVMEKM